MRTNEIHMTDGEVRQEVLREMRWDSRLRGVAVDVSVSEGEVVLRGAVTDASEMLAAIEAARRAEGAFRVSSELRIDPFGGRPRTDANIAEAVRRTLEWDAEIPHEQIQVAVSNGWVALHGTVGRQRDRENVERLARRLEGVRGVYNLVTVEPAAELADDVRDRIEDALRRRAQHEADRIEVQLHGGTVSLSGRLHTWGEKQAILGALTQAPGVQRVDDRLSVDPYF
jgi:osmotically-inducible protein OsmY